MFVPREERVENGRAIRGERVVRVDACVIGTGAGGAPVAKELAEGGMSVAMLEEGEHFTTDDMTARPRDMMPRLYREAGQAVTVGNVPVMLPQGRGVGGTTLVNSGTCFRTPEPVLARWRESFGLHDAHLGGAGALLPPRGARAVGHPGAGRPGRQQRAGGQARRGRPRLVGRLHPPQRARLRGLGRVRVRLPHQREAAHGDHLRAEGVGRGRHHLRRRARDGVRDARRTRRRACWPPPRAAARCGWSATLLVVACGAVHTPLLLGRNGLGGGSGQLGENLAIHPCSAVRRCSTRRSTWRAACPSPTSWTSSPTRGSCSRGRRGRRTTSPPRCPSPASATAS